MVENVSMHWTERVKQKTRELNLSDAKIAREIGCSSALYSMWMNQTRNPKLESKMAIAKALGVSVYWLDTGEEEPNPNALPVISLDDIDAFYQEIENKQKAIKKDSGIRIIESDSESFLIRLDNDSMIDPGNAEKTLIPNGSTIQIDQECKPVPGKILLIDIDGQMLLRVWQRINANQHIFKMINPHYSELKISYTGDVMDIYKGTAVGFSCPL
ncbi:LexA family transcriptional regulator [Endozoicomonas sp. GU-1]|uniref:LexA family transcriptional regulator n=2 Tax=Endozoicomonas TaxID=305899 RepID=UPI0022B423F1|nr:LexA family transcriptional regulator [Endozoicomonas sp. GU-1]WBA81567.1 LexA family transcriptional regulator [Endozoicomonas sp. GU-1]WBA84520.1 LexA family transcriptional regulator [Endozoicomonas sp. GU-1]